MFYGQSSRTLGNSPKPLPSPRSSTPSLHSERSIPSSLATTRTVVVLPIPAGPVTSRTRCYQFAKCKERLTLYLRNRSRVVCDTGAPDFPTDSGTPWTASYNHSATLATRCFPGASSDFIVLATQQASPVTYHLRGGVGIRPEAAGRRGGVGRKS